VTRAGSNFCGARRSHFFAGINRRKSRVPVAFQLSTFWVILTFLAFCCFNNLRVFNDPEYPDSRRLHTKLAIDIRQRDISALPSPLFVQLKMKVAVVVVSPAVRTKNLIIVCVWRRRGFSYRPSSLDSANPFGDCLQAEAGFCRNRKEAIRMCRQFLSFWMVQPTVLGAIATGG
jgi:hypothetical protein